MTEILGGPYTESREKRLSATLNARIGHWEAAAMEKQRAPSLINPPGMARGVPS
jgi:hypothetical protein